jgi:hypothetical protein
MQTECPGAGICAINQTWSAVPGGWCMCPLGLAGANCDQLCPFGQWGLALAMMELILALFLSGLALLNAWRLFSSTQKGSKPPLPILCILAFSGTGCLVFAIHSIISSCNTMGFAMFYREYVVGGRQVRRTPTEADFAVYILYGLGACVGVCSLFVLPLTWVSEGYSNLIIS